MPAGTYRKLYDMGQLEIAEGLRVQPPAALWDLIRSHLGQASAHCAGPFQAG